MNRALDWLAMGGYSTYVWSAYGLVCFVLLINLFAIKWKKKQTLQKLNQWFKGSEHE